MGGQNSGPGGGVPAGACATWGRRRGARARPPTASGGTAGHRDDRLFRLVDGVPRDTEDRSTPGPRSGPGEGPRPGRPDLGPSRGAPLTGS